MNIQFLLSKKISRALISAGINADYKFQICQSTKEKFGNYQVNMITEAKKLGMTPQNLAKVTLTHLNLTGIASKIEIAGHGFINIFLDPGFLSQNIDKALKSECLGINKHLSQTVVVDYSSPNVAKEMHVGHLRSTIIGDAVVRTLEFLGHKVIRANHIGDWGTQFGMLIAYLEKQQHEKNKEIELEDLENFYCKAKKLYDESKVFAKRAREYVVKLQNGNKYLLQIWRKLVDTTMMKNQKIYDRLNVTLTRDNIMGESLYNSMLPEIVKDLQKKGLAVESEGAIVVFLDVIKNKLGKQMGVVIQKKDGGYLYTTTDIACAKYRYEVLHADRILYYVDSRQQQHLIQVQSIVHKAGYVPYFVSLEHHMFGMVLGKDRKPFKTRTGKTIKLEKLLDEALKRARCMIIKKNPNIPDEELEKLANVVGIGALKYADLSKNRTTDYIFDFNNMLTLDGNTAPYIQYAYTRILSIFRKAKMNEDDIFSRYSMTICENREAKLAFNLLQFEETLNVVARDGTPHVMCAYLYNLAGLFSNFYEHCKILTEKNNVVRNSRLKLAKMTEKTLKIGLNILGIETIERM